MAALTVSRRGGVRLAAGGGGIHQIMRDSVAFALLGQHPAVIAEGPLRAQCGDARNRGEKPDDAAYRGSDHSGEMLEGGVGDAELRCRLRAPR